MLKLPETLSRRWNLNWNQKTRNFKKQLTVEETIQVAIVEDDREIRQTLALIIDGTPGYQCEHTFLDAESAIDALASLAGDVVLMDIELPRMNGIEAIK